jgi:hypothetical protein
VNPSGINEDPSRTLQERLTLNEAIERELNAHRASDLGAAGADGPGWSGLSSFWCECSTPLCGQQLEIAADEWNEVRSHANRFFIAPDHDDVREGAVISRGNRFWVIEKDEKTSQRIAERTDPRNSPYL